MTVTIPSPLVDAIRDGRTILFLGSGASKGAKDKAGNCIPTAQELANLLANEFLDSTFVDNELRVVYDLACSERDVRTIQRRVYEIINKFQPPPHHFLIPSFAWAGIATTNYDLLVERAYENAPTTLQTLLPNVNDRDGAADRVGVRSVLYVKLHGCISRYQETTPPLVNSTEQLIAYRSGRKGQFDTFLEWAKTKTIVFTGYSFRDSNMRTLLDEIIREGDNRPRHYMVDPAISDIESRYWRERRIETVNATFRAFLETIDQEIVTHQRTLGALAADTIAKSTISRFISTPGAIESRNLQAYLESHIEHVSQELDPVPDEPKRFYSGFGLGWYPIAANLDVRQPIVDDVLAEHVAAASVAARQSLVVIKGHAGAGKSVVLRRVCWEAAKKYKRLCFFADRQHVIESQYFEEIFRLTNVPVFLFVDNLADHRSGVQAVMGLAKNMTSELVVIGTETYPIWNVACDELEPLVTNTQSMRYLSEPNIVALVEKLEKHGSLGYLQNLTQEDRVHELQHVHGRQLLVALLEATHGTPLEEIVANEYRSIPTNLARLLYLDICSLFRFGAPVRAGLIARIHDITFDQFRETLFEPLEGVVVLREDRKSGDYVYEARHPYIAHTVYEVAVTSTDERFENVTRILAKLNPSYSYDSEVVARVLRSDNLIQSIGDTHKIRQIYEIAAELFGDFALVYHQRGVFEINASSDLPGLEGAEKYLYQAEEIEPYNRAIQHSFAELDLRRSRMSTDPLQRQSWRQRAVARASKLAKGSSPYPHHTMLKAAVDEVRDALSDAEKDEIEHDARPLAESIASAESVLRRGLEAFPNESILLSEEGNLSNVLAQAVRAEAAFERAYRSNPRSTRTADRLARIKRAKGNYDEAQTILQKCLEHNPGANQIHYQLAMTIRESRPDADFTESDTIVRHLRRAIGGGGQSRQAKFWYARQLTISGRYDEARGIFRELANAPIPFREKKELRGFVRAADGSARPYTGSVTRLVGGTFLRCEAPNLSAYFAPEDLDADMIDLLSVGDTVQFDLAFNLLGPVAVNIRV